MKTAYQKTFANYLSLQRLAPKTRSAYLQSVKGLTAYFQQPAEQLTNDQIQDYLLYCIQEKKLAWASCNVLFCGLKKFYHGYLGRDNAGFSIPPRPRAHQLPMLLSREEVSRIIKAPENMKHHALLALIYGSGLRVSEAVRLRAENIDSKKMLVRIDQSKGRKDRYTILSKHSLELLREYWRTYQPGKWLFFTKDRNKPMPSETAQKIFYLAKQKAGITRGRGIHTLRHCFASHALEQGVQLFVLKRWLGHASIKTTCMYLHASPEMLQELIESSRFVARGGSDMKPQYEIADIFRRYGDDYRQNNAMNGDQRKVMAAIIACRTAQLGGHQEVCEQCGHLRNCYNSCRNRHCPKCQTMAKEKWLEKRREELLPTGYFHMVFTVPHILNPLILDNKKELLGCLFTAVRNTVFAFAADPQWRLEGKPGLLTILHTRSQTLIDHFHIHCLIPAGVLSMDGKNWVASKDDFLFHVVPLAKEFKKRYLGLVDDKLESLTLPKNSTHLLQEAWGKDWIVYAKKPFAGPEQVLNYLGRYTHRIAINNHRIKAIEDNRVVFTYKDRSEGNNVKTMELQATEFIRRFLIHVLPYRFMKIRYYGFLANNCKTKAILLIRRLIGKAITVFTYTKETIREKMFRLTGNDILLCPHCRKGTMTFRALLYADSS